MNAAIKQRHGFEGFHLAGQVRRIPPAGQSIGYTRLVVGDLFSASRPPSDPSSRGMPSTTSKDARKPTTVLAKAGTVSRRPVSDRRREPPTHFGGSEKCL